VTDQHAVKPPVFYAGATATVFLSNFVDEKGQPIVLDDHTVTCAATVDPAPTVAPSPPVRLSGNEYRFRFTPDRSGDWTVWFTGKIDDADYVKPITIRVEPGKDGD
jgi:hypothetical protein